MVVLVQEIEPRTWPTAPSRDDKTFMGLRPIAWPNCFPPRRGPAESKLWVDSGHRTARSFTVSFLNCSFLYAIYFETFLVLYWFIDQVSVWFSTFYLPMAGNLNPRIDPSYYYWWQRFFASRSPPGILRQLFFYATAELFSTRRRSELWVELHS